MDWRLLPGEPQILPSGGVVNMLPCKRQDKSRRPKASGGLEEMMEMGTLDWIFIGLVSLTPLPLLSLLMNELTRACGR